MNKIKLTRERDWVGNKNSIFKTLGSSSHAEHEREQRDYYATEPKATHFIMQLEKFTSPILEPACGEGHMSEVIKQYGYEVVSYDIVDRGYGEKKDFFTIKEWNSDIITNPPYKIALEFVENAIDIIPEGRKVAFFLKTLFLEGRKRKLFFEKHPPIRIWISSSRLKCAMNGNFNTNSSAVSYSWFVWVKGFKGDPIIKWFN